MARRNNDEGTIAQRADGRWAVALSLGTDPTTGKRVWKATVKKTKKEAQAQLKAWHAANDAGQNLMSDALTVAELMEKWIQTCEGLKRKPKTMRGYRQMVDLYIVPRLGKRKVAQVDPYTVQRFLDETGRTGSNGQPISTQSVLHVRAALRAAFNFAVRWRVITRNPICDTVTPEQVEYQANILSPADARRVLDAIPSQGMYGGIFALMLGVGMRPSEVRGLRWQDVQLNADATGGTVTVSQQVQYVSGEYHVLMPKTKSGSRSVPLPDFVAVALVRRRSEQQIERQHAAEAGCVADERWSDLVFTGQEGLPYSERYAVRKFHDFLARLGVADIRLYELRHTCVSFLCTLNVEMKVVSTVVGHADERTTRRFYQKVMDGSKVAAANAMGQMMAAATEGNTP